MFKLTPNSDPKWFEIRKQISRALVWVARKVNPGCAYSYTYYMEQEMKAQMDAMTFGQGALRVTHVPISNIIEDGDDEK